MYIYVKIYIYIYIELHPVIRYESKYITKCIPKPSPLKWENTTEEAKIAPKVRPKKPVVMMPTPKSKVIDKRPKARQKTNLEP